MAPKKTSVLSSLKGKVKSAPKSNGALWQGPEATGSNGGITFSMLSKWLTCRRRFQVRYVEGWEPTKQFSHRLFYGNAWHVCEEAFASEVAHFGEYVGTTLWEDNLKKYTQEECKRFPLSQQDILHWYNVCKVQFPVYINYWSKNQDVVNRTPLLQEQVFDVPYNLPSGRTVRLRGKWDSVDLIDEGKEMKVLGQPGKRVGGQGVYLQENKTKGDIDELALQRQLTFDLQTMLYLVALQSEMNAGSHGTGGKVLKGVRYNVVRRPLSGGEGTIVQKKGSKNVLPETDEEFYGRVKGVIDGTGVKSTGENYTGPSHWFMRWKFDVTPQDVKRFRDECLDPILECLCSWYRFITDQPDKPEWMLNGLHYRHPFGCDNAITEFGASDVDAFLDTGSTVGMHKREHLFEELT